MADDHPPHRERHPPGAGERRAGVLLRDAEEDCRARGLQLTPLRRRIFEELASADGPLGAYDLVELLGREKRIAPISVYRVLDFLIEAGLIHRIATQNTYLPCHHPHHEHETMVFLVCSRCGNVDEMEAPDVAERLGGMAEAAGFKPSGKAVEIEGECAGCREAPPVPPPAIRQAGA